MKAVKVIIAAMATVAVGGGIFYHTTIRPQLQFASVATAFAAKKMCSCLHVAELSFEQCKADFTDDVSMANFSADGPIITVDVLDGRISSAAIHTPGLGCQLLPDAVLNQD